MENQPSQGSHPSNPRRKTRSKIQVFKEVYLPLVILAVAVAMVVGIAVGLSSCGSDPDGSKPSANHPDTQLQQEATALVEQAQQLALSYDFDGALELLNSFSGDADEFPELKNAINEYTAIKYHMVSWSADQVPNLSLHVLIADLNTALADPGHGKNGTNRYNQNFVTTDEFSAILQQLYDNGYVLVDLSDFYVSGISSYTGKEVFFEKSLLLPAGKKPIMLTETHCNYYSYMVDKDEDGQADKNGAGFASKLCWNNGFYNEMVTADGSTVTGAFDLVPILENFIQLHPDFSYKGARAILAFSGYDGIFGYRVTSETLGGDALAKEQTDAAKLIAHLRDTGYTMACYTYRNVDYSVKSASDIREDIQLWQEKIAPIVGQTNVLVFAWEADIGTTYENNDKFDVLYEGGYRFFLGSTPFLSQETDDLYVRHNRLMVTASTLHHHGEWFAGILDNSALLDPQRGNIPQ